MTLERKKVLLAQWILGQSDESLVDQMREFARTKFPAMSSIDFSLKKYATTIEDRVNLDKIKSEQGFTTVDNRKIERLIAEAEIPQSIEELLADLD